MIRVGEKDKFVLLWCGISFVFYKFVIEQYLLLLNLFPLFLYLTVISLLMYFLLNKIFRDARKFLVITLSVLISSNIVACMIQLGKNSEINEMVCFVSDKTYFQSKNKPSFVFFKLELIDEMGNENIELKLDYETYSQFQEGDKVSLFYKSNFFPSLDTYVELKKR